MYIKTKSKTLDATEKTLIMGILNATPDSFSDGGCYDSIDLAVRHAIQMEKDGADIIDIGGESTRPDHQPISAEEEIARVIPMIKAIKESVQIPVSIDTYKAKTAAYAIDAGADMINDIWGAKRDREMASVAAERKVPIILMHNRNHKQYQSIINDMITELTESIEIANEAGVKDEQIILDPGIGFGKDMTDNFTVLRHLDQLINALPHPFLLAASRKSFITKVLDVPAEERDNATGATTCFGIQKGVHMIRVHDVKRHRELCRMTEAMLKGVQ